jgi:nucleoside 2-deoxyribosyltransferase
MRLYMAGPLFTAAERAFNANLRDDLVYAGHDVWLPQERAPQKDATPGAIFHSNMVGIRWSQVVLACIDGADADSGTSWEVGFAYASEIPVVLYRTDFRPAGDDKWVNLMLSVSARVLVRAEFLRLRDVATEINRALTEVERGLQV